MHKHPIITLFVASMISLTIGLTIGLTVGNYQGWVNEAYFAPTILKVALGLFGITVSGFLIGTVFDGISGGILDTLGKIGAVIAVGLIAFNWSYIVDEMGGFAILASVAIAVTATTTAIIIHRKSS